MIFFVFGKFGIPNFLIRKVGNSEFRIRKSRKKLGKVRTEIRKSQFLTVLAQFLPYLYITMCASNYIPCFFKTITYNETCTEKFAFGWAF